MSPKPPAALKKYLADGRCVLFAGAGLSAWAELPTWGKLLRQMIDEVQGEDPGRPENQELEKLMQQWRYLEVAEYCRQQLGSFRTAEILRENLGTSLRGVPKPHRIIVRLPFAGVITTNYDTLLEDAYRQLANIRPRVLTHMDTKGLGALLFDRSLYVLKAHGDIGRAEELVLTSREYQEIIHANPAFSQVFSAVLLTRAVLFVGYSINDPDFRLLLDRQLSAFDEHVPPRYALMTGLGQVERQLLWETARIKVISFEREEGHADGPYHQLLRFLEALEAGLPDSTAADTEARPESPVANEGVVRLESARVRPTSFAAPGSRSDKGLAPFRPGTEGSSRESPSRESPSRESPARGLPSRPLDTVLSHTDEGSEGVELPRGTLGVGPGEPDQDLSVDTTGYSLSFEPSTGAKARAEAGDETDIDTAASANLSLNLRGGMLRARLEIDDQAAVVGDQPWIGAQRHWLEQRGGLRLALGMDRGLGQDASQARMTQASVGQSLFRALPEAVGQALEALPTKTRLDLTLAPSLACWPWELLWLDDSPAALHLALSRRPPVARVSSPDAHRSLHVLLVGDPGGPGLSLQGALQEVNAVAEEYQKNGHKATRLVGPDASFARLAEEFAELPDMLHVASHGGYADGEAFMMLADNDQLRASELRTFFGVRPPLLLVFASNLTAFVPSGVGVEAKPVSATDLALEPRATGYPGFSESALAAGAGAVIGTFGMVSDHGAHRLGLALHRQLLDGVSLAEALRRARGVALSGDPDDPTPLLFSLAGDGDLRLGKP